MSQSLMLAFNTHIVNHLRTDINNLPEFGPDIYQQPIIQALGSAGSNHIFADAVAGGGKSTLIKFANQAIGGQTTIKTSSSHGFEALRKKFKTKPINGPDYKYSDICADLCETEFNNYKDRHKAKSELRELVAFCMNSLCDIDDTNAILDTIDRYGIEVTVPKIVDLVKPAIREGLKLVERYGVIGFIDMLYWPVVLDLPITKYDFVLADEAQDFNAIQVELTKRSIKDTGSSLTVADEDQSMYGFAGALPDSCDKIIKATGAKVMPLSFCYRCPTSHLDLARKIVPKIRNSPFAKSGEVNYIECKDLHRTLNSESMVLCRFTAPLVKTCIQLIGKGIGATVRGSEIGKSLVKVIENCRDIEGGNNRITQFPELVTSYYQEQADRLARKKNSERQIEVLNDKCNALRSAYDGMKPSSFEDFGKQVEGLFSEKKGIVMLSTIHRAKGLESNDVTILNGGRCRLPVKFKDSLPWEDKQESNIHYVALTRSKQKLTFVTDDVMPEFAENDPSKDFSVASLDIHSNEKLDTPIIVSPTKPEAPVKKTVKKKAAKKLGLADMVMIENQRAFKNVEIDAIIPPKTKEYKSSAETKMSQFFAKPFIKPSIEDEDENDNKFPF